MQYTGDLAMAAERLRDMGLQHQKAGDFAGAERALRSALRLAPGDARIRALLGEVLLGEGRYREGWPLFEARMDVPELGSPRPPLDEPEWRGELLAGKRLLIVGEQGAGDQIMFARFAPLIQAQGAQVALLCLQSLARLFAGSLGVEVYAMAGRIDMPDPDVWCLSGSLAGRLGVTLDTLPGRAVSAGPGSAHGRADRGRGSRQSAPSQRRVSVPPLPHGGATARTSGRR